MALNLLMKQWLFPTAFFELMDMRLEKFLFPFFLALLISPPLLPAPFSEKAYAIRVRGDGYTEKVRLSIKKEERVPPHKWLEFMPGGNRKENILIILDASGSMWGQISLRGSDNTRAQRCKIEIARKVLEEYIDDLDEQKVNLGLRVFGQNREKGCKDSQLIIPVGPLDKKAFKRMVGRVNPGHLGKTPIAYSLRKALVDISTPSDIRRFIDSGELSGGKKSIMMITDGEGGCGNIEEVRGLEHDLRLLGVDIVKISVIELKESPKEKRDYMAEQGIQLDMGTNLQKITQKTAGQYIRIEAKPGMGIEEFERQFSKSMRIVAPTNTKERILSLLYRSGRWVNGFISTHMSATIIPSIILFSIFFIFSMKWFFRK
ncbi:MAG: VWA domain-containing protein [Syntrophobacterales bacterium]|nr:MAG: VWA domain-containing protein [Syntrophobacterales bacterium]